MRSVDVLSRLCSGTPDGRPLYAYKVSNDDFAALRRHLQRRLAQLNPDQVSNTVAALFCLFTAEFSRRDPAQIGRTWAPVTEALGIDLEHAHLTDWTERGLERLERPLQRTQFQRLFRVTLGCEGGLALERLAASGEGAVARYFRSLLLRFRDLGRTGREDTETLTQDARAVEASLPATLRNDVVHTLAAQLTGTLWSYRSALQTDADPVLALDQKVHGWRDKLPLVLSDDAADRFLRGLMADVRTAAEGTSFALEVVTFLSMGDVPRLQRRLSVPRDFSDKDAASAFPGVATTSAMRFTVIIRSMSGQAKRLGVLRRHDDGQWSGHPEGDVELQGDSGDRIRLELGSRAGATLSATEVRGLDELGSLPWVFTDDPTRRFLGSGAVRSSRASLLVAVPTSMQATQGQVEPLGIAVCDRELVRVCGMVEFEGPEASIRIRAGAAVDSEPLELRGPLLEPLDWNHPIWLGIPRIVRLDSLGATDVIDVNVRPVSAGTGQLFPPAGRLELSVEQDGEVVFLRRVTVVPSDSSISIQTVGHQVRPGTLEFRGSDLRAVSCEPTPGLQTTAAHSPTGAVRVDFLAPTSTVTRTQVTLQFGQARVTGRVLVPVRSVRFEDLDGNLVLPDQRTHVMDMGRFRAVAMTPRQNARISLRIDLREDGLCTTTRYHDMPSRNGAHVIELSTVQRQVLDLLNRSTMLDAEVRLSVEEIGGNNHPTRFMRFYRYDWEIVVDYATGDIHVDPPLTEEDAGRLTVEARPFSAIHQAMFLPRLRSALQSQPTWTFRPQDHAPEGFLLFVSDGPWYRCRPRPITGQGPGTTPAQGLAGAMQHRDEGERLEGLRTALNGLLTDHNHPDWNVLDGYLQVLGDIPAATFDLMRIVAERPAAAAHCAARLAMRGPRALVRAWDGLRELNFMWEAVPMQAWWQALDATSTRVGDAAPIVVESIVGAVAEELPTIRAVYETWPSKPGPPTRLPPPVLALAQRDEALRAAIQRLVDAQWPRSPQQRFELGPSWTPRVTTPHLDMDVAFEATTALALAAVRGTALPPEHLTYLSELRAFDETFFQDSYFWAFAAAIAHHHMQPS